MYTHGDVAALRDALQEGLSISSAVSRAREAVSGDTNVLAGALGSYELDRAETAMEGAIALRSVERSVEEVLLPGLQEIGERHGFDSAPWAFAARWGRDWLLRAQRLSPPPNRAVTVLIGDATGGDLEMDALAMRALELFCSRAGARVLPLPVSGVSGLAEVITAFSPQAVVIAGASVADDDVARWAYGVRTVSGALPVALFRRVSRGRTTGATLLDDGPLEAHRQVLGIVDSQYVSPFAPATPEVPEAELAFDDVVPSVGRRWLQA